ASFCAVNLREVTACLVKIEACASSHHWSRELQALGHTVRLMPPAYVKPYAKRQKNDTTDAEAICEAARHAVRADQDGRAAELSAVSSCAGSPGRALPARAPFPLRALTP